jgi:hypothetical protein
MLKNCFIFLGLVLFATGLGEVSAEPVPASVSSQTQASYQANPRVAPVPAPKPNDNPRAIGIPPIQPMGKLPPGGFEKPVPPPPSPGPLSKPFPQRWNDRRPIGNLYMGSTNGPIFSKNPAGWIFDELRGGLLDYTTTAGIILMQERFIQTAKACVERLKAINAQGIIVWDADGEQFFDMQFLGMPNAIPWMTPEFDQVSDQFFNIFKRAGLRIGMCLRADIAMFYNVVDHDQKPYDSMEEAMADLDSKLTYAHDRWGCTLFYVDSNSGGGLGVNNKYDYKQGLRDIYPAELFKRLSQNIRIV